MRSYPEGVPFFVPYFCLQMGYKKWVVFVWVGLFSAYSFGIERNRAPFQPNIKVAAPCVPGLTGVEKICERSQTQWPYVYPELYKYGAEIGLRPVKLPGLSSLKAFALGLSGEFLWNQVLFYGLSYELVVVPKNKYQATASMHRLQLNTGLIYSLDDDERNHLLFYFRPGLSNLRTQKGAITRPGICLGIGYEFAYNSDYYLSPEIMYYRYPILDKYPYGLSGWMFGIRIMKGK